MCITLEMSLATEVAGASGGVVGCFGDVMDPSGGVSGGSWDGRDGSLGAFVWVRRGALESTCAGAEASGRIRRCTINCVACFLYIDMHRACGKKI